MILEVRSEQSEQRCASARMLQEMRLPEPCIHSGLMSPIGTKRESRADLAMSVDGGWTGSGWPTLKPTRLSHLGHKVIALRHAP